MFRIMALISLVSLSLFLANMANAARTCHKFEEVEQHYRLEPENISNKLGYGMCLIIHGEHDKGLPLLHQLAREPVSNIIANYWLAEHVRTGGTLTEFSYENLNEAINRYLHTSAIIKANPDYPGRDYSVWEKSEQVELNSYNSVPLLYYRRYDAGFNGSHNLRLLDSPSYKGDRNAKTFPEFNTTMLESLNEVVEHAQVCMNVPYKHHFEKDIFFATRDSCRVLKDTALEIRDLEVKRQEILTHANCQDLNEENCPEYGPAFYVIKALIKDSFDALDEIWDPVNERN